MADETTKNQKASSPLGALPQVGGAIVGLTAVAYVAGWSESTAYYEALGAPWVVSLLPARYLLLSTSYMVVAFIFGAYFATAQMIEGADFRKVRRIFTWGAIVALVAYALGWIMKDHGKLALGCQEQIGSGYTFAALSGFTAAILVIRLSESELQWQRVHMGLLFTMTVYGIWQSPTIVGKAHADLDGDSTLSQLPVAAHVNQPNELWRLVTSIDGRLVLVQLGPQKKDRVFRTTSSPDGWMVLPPS